MECPKILTKKKFWVYSLGAILATVLWVSNAAGVFQVQAQATIGDRIIGFGVSVGTQVLIPAIEVGKMPQAKNKL